MRHTDNNYFASRAFVLLVSAINENDININRTDHKHTVGMMYSVECPGVMLLDEHYLCQHRIVNSWMDVCDVRCVLRTTRQTLQLWPQYCECLFMGPGNSIKFCSKLSNQHKKRFHAWDTSFNGPFVALKHMRSGFLCVPIDVINTFSNYNWCK